MPIGGGFVSLGGSGSVTFIRKGLAMVSQVVLRSAISDARGFVRRNRAEVLLVESVAGGEVELFARFDVARLLPLAPRVLGRVDLAGKWVAHPGQVVALVG